MSPVGFYKLCHFKDRIYVGALKKALHYLEVLSLLRLTGKEVPSHLLRLV
jgi:hypothetical protein